MGVLDFLNPLNAITGSLERAYTAKLNAGNDKDRIAAEVEIENLKARRDVVLSAARDPWWSPRTIMGWCVAAFVVKVVLWDTVLGLGVTPNPGSMVWWIVVTVIGFYFFSKSAEQIASTIAGAISRK
ncbi:MAG: hypothetical protein WC829_10715 [Hyphomicrobium sp.]|jgi:hypothetical protein